MEKCHKFGNGIKYLRVFLYLVIHFPYFYLNPTISPNHIINLDKMQKYSHSDTHLEHLTPSIFLCISFSWLSHSLLSTSNLSSSSAFSLNQSLSLCSSRQCRSMAVECVSARSLRCSSLSWRSVEVSPRCSRALRDATEPGPAADWTPPLTNPAPSLASN